MCNKKNFFLVIVFLLMCFGFMGEKTEIQAASNPYYGMLIADSKGRYTFYDFNGEKGTQRIEKASNGTVMIPLRAVCATLPSVSYTYNWDKCEATLKNVKTGKYIVLKKNNQYLKLYSSKGRLEKKIKMGWKMYQSASSKAAMADNKVFQYLFATSTGCKNYLTSSKAQSRALVNAGYDGAKLQGIMVWNPYKKITAIPDATKILYSPSIEPSNIIKVTIPEGYSVAQIAKLLVDKGVCQSTKAVLAQANKIDLNNYSFYDNLEDTQNRCFNVEGYLFCSTYEFYRNTSPSAALNKLVNGMNQLIKPEDIEKAHELGYTMDQIITIASMIEKEVGKESEQAKVSSVLHNRLAINMKLQCDCSIHYVEKYIKHFITGDINRYNSFYNTYKCSALPAGPICNPSKKAIRAALNPEETNYLFFCSDENGEYYYSDTLEDLKQISGK